MASRSCVSGCGRFLTSWWSRSLPSCLGFRHAEAALVDESCSHCGNMTMAMLRSRYLLARRGGIPLALPRSSSSGRRTTSAQGQGDLRITVRASPSSTSPRASHSSSTSHRLGFPDEGVLGQGGAQHLIRCPSSMDSPISQAGLFGEAVEDFAQQFSAAQKQTEAFRHILPRRSAGLHPHRRLQPLRLLVAGAPSCCLHLRSSSATTAACTTAAAWSWPQETRRSRLRPAKPVKRQGRRRPWDGRPEPLDPALQEMVTAPLLPPEEGRVENFCFLLFWYPKLQ